MSSILVVDDSAVDRRLVGELLERKFQCSVDYAVNGLEALARMKGVAPDLMVLFGDLDWRSVGSVGNDSIYTFENDTGPDDANHNIDGLFICSGAAAPQRGHDRISIYDMAPTVLSQLGMTVPGDMVGRNRLES